MSTHPFRYLTISLIVLACGRNDGGINGGGGNYGQPGSGSFGTGWGQGYGSGSNGSGNFNLGGSQLGGSGTTYNMPFGDVTKYFMPKGVTPDPNSPTSIKFSGKTEIQNFTCEPYQVVVVNGYGTSIAPIQNMQVLLSDTGEGVNRGAFYSKSDCGVDSIISGITFGLGQATKTVYYKSPTSRETILNADGNYGGGPVIGRFHINIKGNAANQLPICFNFEDLYGKGGDSDFNDAVVEARSATLYPTPNNTVKSFDNQTITLKVSGTSACDSSVKLENIDPMGRVVETRTVDSARQGAAVTFNVLFGSEVRVSFSAKSYCAKGWVSAKEGDVRVRNVCRNASQESQAWN